MFFKQPFKIKHVLVLALLAGTISAFGMMLYWHFLGLLFGDLISLPQIDELVLLKENFSWLAVLTYNIETFSASFVLSFLYYLAAKFMPTRPVLGLIFYSLFGSVAFMAFVSLSVFKAQDMGSLLLLFLLDDYPQALLIMLPIMIFAPVSQQQFAETPDSQ